MNNPFAGLDNIATEPSAPQPPAPQQPGQSEERWKPSPPETPPSQSRRWLWWAVGGIIVLGLVGGGYFAYSKGYLPIPFLTPKTDALFDKMVASITDIKTAQYSARVKLTGQPRSGKATSIFPKKTNANDNTNAINEVNLNSNTNGNFQIEPIGSQLGLGEPSPGYLGVLLALADPKEILQGIPVDVKFDGGITLSVEADKPAVEANGSVRLDGAYTGGDLTVAIDVEARKKNKDLYAIVNKFPSIFIDPSAIKGKWIKITTEDDSFVTDETYEQFNTKQTIEAMKTGLATALKEKVITVKQKLPAETVAGVKSEHYLINFNPDALTKMYEKLRDEKRGKGENTALYDDMLKALQKPETMDQLKRIVDNSRVEVWVDRVNGYLRQISWALTIVPPEGNERLKDKQFLAEFTLTLEGVNEKIAVDVPSSTIDLDEATRLITGITKEEQQAQKQLDRVSAVLSSLRQYKDAQKAYPDSLETLSTYITEAKAVCKANEPTGTARERARDAKRKSDLRMLALMLQEYSDANSRYPTSLAEVNMNVNLGTIPKDPESNQDYGYTACENNQGFVLTTTLEAYNNGKLYSLDSTGNTKLDEKLACTASLTGPLQRVPSTESSCSTLKYSANKFNTTDLYTNKPFGYAIADNDYRLTYQVKLDDIKESYTKETYIDGTNTATSADQSIEKETSYEKSERERKEKNVNTNTNLNTNSTPVQNSTVVPTVTSAEHPRGASNATLTLVEYADLESPYEVQLQTTMEIIMANYGKNVRWVLRHYPLSFHSGAEAAALGTICARKNGSQEQYWRFIEDLMSMAKANNSKITTENIAQAAKNVGLNESTFSTCQSAADTKATLETEKQGGTIAGVSGTPTTFLLDQSGKVLRTIAGAQLLSTFTSTLNIYVSSSSQDTDGDGLADDYEKYVLWTSPSSKDTDNDGFDDASEINNSYNPTGDGKATADQLRRWGKS